MHKGAGSGSVEVVFEVLSEADLLCIAGYPTGVQLKSSILLSKGREEGWRNSDSIQSSFMLVNCGFCQDFLPSPFKQKVEEWDTSVCPGFLLLCRYGMLVVTLDMDLRTEQKFLATCLRCSQKVLVI